MSSLLGLPAPVTELWDWQLHAGCRGRDSSLFFHPDDAPRSSRRRREANAKLVCARCPVRAECAAHALAAHERYGVWGGFTEKERRRLVASGWEDLADHTRGRVDVVGLQARLGRRCGPAWHDRSENAAADKRRGGRFQPMGAGHA